MASSPHALSLRLELKQWEAAFLEDNGRKPSREDIKKAPGIAAKYKEYNKLRDPGSSSAAPPKPPPEQQQRQFQTPRKSRFGHTSQTPTASNSIVNSDDPFNSPSAGRSQRSATQGSTRSMRSNRDPHQTPTNPNRIIGGPGGPGGIQFESPLSIRKLRFGQTVGPTPQKTGKVLGLFESMASFTPPRPASSRNIFGSPSKASNMATVEQANSPFETPRKRKHDSSFNDSSPSIAHSATNTASHTPVIPADGETPKKRRPTEDMFATPSFLRRSSSKIFEPSQLDASPPVPMMKRGLVKGLSSLMADLRKAQDDALDEEMELMREMEAEAEGRDPAPTEKKALFPPVASTSTDVIAAPAVDTAPKIANVFDTDKDVKLVPENGEEESSSDEENEHGDKPFTRTWKKRGLKRQTRRVKMKPVKNKPSAPAAAANESSDSEEVEESAAHDGNVSGDDDEVSNFSGSDNDKDDNDDPETKASKPIGRLIKKKATTAASKTKATKATASKAKKKGTAATGDDEETSTTAPAKKGKRAATTGANFRRLNIRTQGGMKGRGRGGGRFNRRR
ncbi:DNA replication/checkpoint protein [Peziza echinospora]|nr:DNA replication/checkpoint protein [Peziza echinospora]